MKKTWSRVLAAVLVLAMVLCIGKKTRCKYGHILENMQTKKILFLINN